MSLKHSCEDAFDYKFLSLIHLYNVFLRYSNTHNVGGVGGLRRVKSAIKVARYVLDNTDHTLLIGDQGLKVESVRLCIRLL